MSDFLENFTKAEIIFWIRNNCTFRQPQKRDLLWCRWEIKSQELLQKREKLHKEFNSIKITDSDGYAKFKLFQQKEAVLQKEEKKLDKLFNSLNKK